MNTTFIIPKTPAAAHRRARRRRIAAAASLLAVAAEAQMNPEGVPSPVDGGPAIATTLDGEIAQTVVRLKPGYAAARPRLLFGADDREALRQKAKQLPELWAEVMRKARMTRPDNAPPAADIEAGRRYWRVEQVQSAALAAFVAGEDEVIPARAAAAWMLAHCRVAVWGNEYRPNRDLQASWNLYHIALGYDILHGRLTAGERDVIRAGLADHARALAAGIRDHEASGIRYDQNHTYIPAAALAAAALALQGETPEAEGWLRLSAAVMRRCRYALGEDGYYYEGTGYWSYALHWHARWAELMERATGAALFDLPALAENWRYALLMTLPGPAGAFDVGDTALWQDATRPALRLPNTTMLWAVARARRSAEAQYAGNLMQQRQRETDYPAAAFLWHDDTLAAADPAAIPPRHWFRDHGVVAWRSGWAADDTAALFRCGPPQGHAATAKRSVMKDWTMNSGHVHPDIGAFWLHARGAYLAVDTGYLDEKRTADHNTLLVGGRGQAMDGTYHNDHGMDYARFDRARMTRVQLAEDHAFAQGEFSSVYPEDLGLARLRRTVVMTRDGLVVLDEMEAARPQALAWFCHSDTPFEAAAGAFVARGAGAALAVVPLGPAETEGGNRRSVISAGSAPGRGRPLETIHHLRLETPAAPAHRLATVLLALGADEAPPAARLLEWRDGRVAVEWTRAGRVPERMDIDVDRGTAIRTPPALQADAGTEP